MALMMDNKPTEYKGEALVWEKLSSLLPNDVVVYNHREVVDDREFDFALLIKNVGSNGVQGVQTRLKRKDRFESK